MKLKLTLRSGEATADVLVTVDGSATVGQVAERLRSGSTKTSFPVMAGPSLSLRVNPGTSLERVVNPSTAMHEAGVRSGDVVTLTNASGESSQTKASVATLRVVSGADTGKTFNLGTGTTILGRDRSCDIRFADPMISKRHAKLNIGDAVEVIDDNSANGVQVADESVQRAILRPTDEVRIGDTVFTVTLHTAGGAGTAGGPNIEFNRSPRLDPQYRGVELVAPEPPQRSQPQRFPLMSMLAPLLMAGAMFAITKSMYSLIFVALSPLMMLASYFEGKMAAKKGMKQATAEFRTALRDLAVQLQYASDMERTGRRHEHPSVDEVRDGVLQLSPVVWTRRPEHESFAHIRLGLGTLPSRNSVKMPTTNNTLPELWRELHEVTAQFSMIDRVPVVADLATCGNLGIAGPAAASVPLAAAALVQTLGLHSPAELIVAAICSSGTWTRWEWLKWTPHSASEHSPIPGEHLAASQNAVATLVSALEDVVAARSAQQREQGRRHIPTIVVVVEDDAAQDRARLVRLAEVGPSVGIHLVWCAAALERVPAACRTYLEVNANTGVGHAGFVQGGVAVQPLELEPIEPHAVASVARRLAPVVDAGALVEDQSDLPRTVSFLTLAGGELGDNPADVIEMWRGSNSLPPEPNSPRLKRDNSLRALVGQAAADRFYLDLRTQGPHALVGGTTGAGKSEFLQSWILGMATAHSPARVNFLFVDYKGGAAFADCVNLPHCVGLVTDLSPHLVRRALRSLTAELRRREHILNAKKAKDLLELERRRDPETPPSLVIIVDEFAALVQEVPEFVEGVVNVAQRGRSLGLHLILATQRPAGVIKDNLRANTNLKVALRMTDEGDSDDVIGTKQAASFDPAIPGRGVAKTGPGRLTAFQSAYVGGYTTNEQPDPVIDVNDLRFAVGNAWETPEPPARPNELALGPNDIKRVVSTIIGASAAASIPEARKPWLPELSPSYRLDKLPTSRTDADLVFGVIDRPDEQDQPTVAFHPDRDGNMAIFGTGGSGKSTMLRTLAVAAGFSTARGGPCHVYGLDFGARGLAMLEALPHVGAIINADDQERTLRLLRSLRATIDDRAERYARVNAASIQEYRDRAGEPNEPRILLMVDNFGAFRQAYELNYRVKAFELLESIAADGRSVGVHVIATADQAGVFTASLNSVIQSKLSLRLTSDMDFTVLGVPPDVFSATSPPGRGYFDDCEVQVAVIGGDPNIAKQAAELSKLAEAMEWAKVPPAPKIERLADFVPLSTLPQEVGAEPILGIYEETLAPITFEPSGVFLVGGPAQSGKTATVISMVRSILATDPAATPVLIATRRSQLADALPWARVIRHNEDIFTEATQLAEKVNQESPELAHLVVVLEHAGDHTSTPHQDAVLELVKACRLNDRFVIAEGETSTLSGWEFMQSLRQDKYGIVLQPDEGDGDLLFSTSFPAGKRVDFPPGRGLYVRAGRVARVQVAAPS